MAAPAIQAALHRRTLRFAVSVAAQLEFPDRRLVGGCAVGEGYSYSFDGVDTSEEEVSALNKALHALIEGGDAITPKSVCWVEALQLMEGQKQLHAKELLESRATAEVSLHECRGVSRLALFPLHASVGALAGNGVKLIASQNGFLAWYGGPETAPSPSLLFSTKDHQACGAGNGVRSVGQLNALTGKGHAQKDFVISCELRQESKLAEIARRLVRRREEGKPVKVVSIAGPTSSGKTTFTTKLCMHLQNHGMAPVLLTVDHYYLPLPDQPKFKLRQVRSDVDYDSVESMEVDLVAEHIKTLTDGKDVEVPRYNFASGLREEPGTPMKGLLPNGILLIEGIHALNPLYTKSVPREEVFKVFISPLTGMQLDDFNTMKTTQHRLVRRMCRDGKFRGSDATKVLSMWDNVRNGEHQSIFPHQNDVDFVMNSCAEYEMCILKTLVEPALRRVRPDHAVYPKAAELMKTLDLFNTWPPHLAPPAALLREFVGDGAFDCH